MADRAGVLRFAEAHGSKAAADRYGVPASTVRSWRARERRRAGRAQADAERAAERDPGPSPLAEFEDRAAQLAAWAARGACLHCGGAGQVLVPATRIGNVTVRAARTIPCPTCGGRPLRIVVTEWPRAAWAEAMRVAGDLGLGWSAESWAKIRAGEPNPNGWRWTERDRIEADADGVVPPEQRPRRRRP